MDNKLVYYEILYTAIYRFRINVLEIELNFVIIQYSNLSNGCVNNSL